MRNRFFVLGLLPGALMASGGRTVSAQMPQTINAECAAPRPLTIQRTLSIGGETDPGHVVNSGYSTSDSRGNILAVGSVGGTTLLRYDSNGNLERSVGGEGQAPGEFGGILSLTVSRGDTVHVLDRANMRHTILDPDLLVVRTRRLPVQPVPDGALRLGDGLWILNANIRTPEEAGWPLHLWDRSGEITNSFGVDEPVFRQDVSFPGHRRLAAADSGRFWAAHVREYRIEEWDPSGTRHRVFRRELEGFEPWLQAPSFLADEERPPSLNDIQVDANGNLWVMITRPAPDWREHIQREPAVYIDFGNYFETVIEVLDPNAACVIASAEVPSFLRGFLDEHRAYGFREDEVGYPYWDVFQIELGPTGN